MINTLTVINYLGEQLTIKLANPFDVGMAITEITGLGPVNANIITTDNATMDGAVYNSSRLSYRNIVITLKLLGTDANGQSIESTRHNVYKYFPIKKPLWLIFESDKRSAMIQGYVESNEPEIFSDWEKTQISIICPDPYFESLNGTVTNFSGVEPLFQFGTELNEEPTFELGRHYTEGDVDIYYTGEVETGVEINMVFKDHVNPITIYNIETNDKITIDTSKIESRYGQLVMGDRIKISTTRGNKKAVLEKANGYLVSVDFGPVQEGIGVPSPTNFREVTGWSGNSSTGIVYGGSLDTDTNILTVRYGLFPLTSNLNWQEYDQPDKTLANVFQVPSCITMFPRTKKARDNSLSNAMIVSETAAYPTSPSNSYWWNSNGDLRCVSWSKTVTLTEWKNYLDTNNVYIVAPLSAVRTYTLTPEEAKQLSVEKGQWVTEEYNIINCLDKNFTWFQLHKGDNIFSYTVEGGQEGGLYDLEMTFNNKILYEGL